MGSQKLVVVSNRLPVSVSKQDGKLIFTPSTGGLATAMSSLDTSGTNRVWVGWPGISSEELTAADKSVITRKLHTYGCYPVFLTKAQVENFYDGYANATLWPLFHYFQSIASYDSHYWPAYKEANNLFHKAVLRQADPQATIWIHDYHLMLLPRLLRESHPKSLIGFFLHIPFPSFEIFRLLPNRKDILEGILGADLVGFHIYDYARHFTSSVLRTLGHESTYGVITLNERTVRADAFPISIDYKKFKTTLMEPTTQAEMATLTNHYRGKKIILSVDRLDYSKGIEKRLEAFEQFLGENPHYHKKVVLIMVAVPSRIAVDAYKGLRDTIEQTVSRINGTYATVDWTPISYQFKNLPFEQVLALFAKADVALITPLRDGMNLVAKEYVASKQKESGVLILSELAGAIDELPEALRINPNDTSSIVKALKRALVMPKTEQRKRLQSMQRRLASYTVQRWASDFMEQLEQAHKSQAAHGQKSMSDSDKDALRQSFKKGKRRILFLDYDGTLQNFVSTSKPEQAAPSRSLLRVIETLSQLPKTEVCVISGRTREALESWFGHIPLTLVAEHGAWVKQQGEWSQQQVSFNKYKRLIRPIMERYAERTPGAEIEEKNFALVWHYRNAPPELAYARNASLKHELQTILNGSEVGVYSGRKIIEVKPRGIHKGVTVDELLMSNPSDFILCIGDDYTDEEMFSVLPETAYSINVGLGATQARFQIPSVEDVRELLESLARQ